jgi:NDP-sugar pyrophosphorylase family protein
MKEFIEKLENYIKDIHGIDSSTLQIIFQNALKEIKHHHKIDKYIGDYPTFIEPVHLGNNVRLGDDVLLGPNVYIGNNCELGDYVELSNTIVLDNVKLGNNFTLENCIVAKECNLNFDILKEKNCLITGKAESKENIKKISF